MTLSKRQEQQFSYFRDRFKEFGKEHYLFACHAAFPLVFTADLLHQLWFNFKDCQLQDENYGIPKVAISDFLLSNLCQDVGLGLYEIREKEIRQYLRSDLQEIFGKDYINRVAAFLYQYAEKKYAQPDHKNLKDTHQWTALATLNPKEAIRNIGNALSGYVATNNLGEQMQVHSLLEELVEQEPVLTDLLEVSKGIQEHQFGNKQYTPVLSNQGDGEFLLQLRVPSSLGKKLKKQVSAEKLIADVIKNNATTLNLSYYNLKELPEIIQDAEHLERLIIKGNKIKNINFISKFTKLKYLNISKNPIKDISPLSNLRELRELFISSTSITDIEPISDLLKIHELNIYNTKISDLEPLSNLLNLKILRIHHTNVSDFKPLTNLKKLWKLRAYHTKVYDLSPLSQLQNLTWLSLEKTRVTDLRPLKHLIEKGVPVIFGNYYGKKGIYVKDCPWVNPPIEIIKKGNDAILTYLKENDTSYKGKREFPKYLSSSFPKFNTNNFIGRVETLNTIDDYFQTRKIIPLGGIKIVALIGLGGIEKTSIARMYCHQYEKNYDHFVWLSQLDSFENTCLNDTALHQNLGLTLTNNTTRDIVNIFYKLNKIPGNNLLVLDNIDSTINSYIDTLPRTWKILLTSRVSLEKNINQIKIDTLDLVGAKKLFRQYFTKTTFSDSEFQDLCKMISYHTLTLELVAKTLQENIELHNVSDLNRILRKKHSNFNILEGEFSNYSKIEIEIFTTLLKLFKFVTLEEREKWLLLQFAVLPSIPHKTKDFLKWIQVGNYKFNDKRLIRILSVKGWIDRKGDTYVMPKMLQNLLRYQTPPTYTNCQGIIDTFINLLHFNQNKDNPVNKFQWVQYGISICKHVSSRESEIGVLNNQVGIILGGLGNYQQAVNHFLKAISIAENNNEKKLDSYKNNLANIYRNLGKYKEAAQLFEVILQSKLSILGENHPNIAISQSNLANVYRDLGNYEEAAQLLEITLKTALKNLGENHPHVAVNQSNLANVYRDLGKYEEAAQLLEIALKTNLNNFEENHPNVAINQSNLANVYCDLGNYEEAAQLLETALKTNLKNFGENHPHVAVNQSSLANIYRDLRNYEEAAQLLETALKTNLKNFGENHPHVVVNQSNLANVYTFLNKYDEALSLHEAALISAKNNLGVEHPEFAIQQANLANIYSYLGRYGEAINLLEISLKSNLKNFGESHPVIANTLHNLGSTYLANQQIDKAITLLSESYILFEKLFGANHINTKQAKTNLELAKKTTHNLTSNVKQIHYGSGDNISGNKIIN